MNAFESGARKLIPAVLVYARQKNKLLMIRKSIPVSGYPFIWNGLGGKLEADESPVQAARRELKEEAGLDLLESSFQALGVLQFPNFKPKKNEDWIVFVFHLEISEQSLFQPSAFQSPEGHLEWVHIDKLDEIPVWPGDRKFLPLVLGKRFFLGTIRYIQPGQRLGECWITPLESRD